MLLHIDQFLMHGARRTSAADTTTKRTVVAWIVALEQFKNISKRNLLGWPRQCIAATRTARAIHNSSVGKNGKNFCNRRWLQAARRSNLSGVEASLATVKNFSQSTGTTYGAFSLFSVHNVS